MRAARGRAPALNQDPGQLLIGRTITAGTHIIERPGTGFTRAMTKLTIGHIVNVHVAGTLFQAFPFIQDLIGPAPRTMIRQRTYTLSTSAFARDAGSSPD